MSLEPEFIALAKGLLLRKDDQHDIAALIGENPGRVAEIKAGMPEFAAEREAKPLAKGKRIVRGVDIAPAPPETLPPPGPYFLNLIAPRDIIESGIEHGLEQVALFIGALESARPRDENALQSAKAARTAMHTALLERRRENWKGRRP